MPRALVPRRGGAVGRPYRRPGGSFFRHLTAPAFSAAYEYFRPKRSSPYSGGRSRKRRRKGESAKAYSMATGRERGAVCMPKKANPFPFRKRQLLMSIAHDDQVQHATTLGYSMITQMTMNQAAGAKLDLNGTWLSEANGLINTAAGGAFHQFETPHYWDQLDTLYEHYHVNWVKFEMVFENIASDDLTLYYKVFKPHEDEDQTTRAATIDEAGAELLQYTPGMKCVHIRGSTTGTEKNMRKKIVVYMNRKGLIKYPEYVNNYDAQWKEDMSGTADLSLTPLNPVFRVWVYNTHNPATAVTNGLRLVTAKALWNITLFGQRAVGLEADDPDA